MEFKKQYLVLLEKAEVDLETAKLILSEIGKGNVKLDLWIVFFHLQQSVEKCLKSLLAFNNVHVLKTHDIGALLTKVEELKISLPFEEDDLKFLSYFAVEGRYGAVLEQIEEPERYFNLGQNLLNFVIKIVRK